MENLNKLLNILVESELDFVLIGGFAAAIHGSVLVTQDIDICMAMKEENLEILRKILKDYNPWHRMNPKAKRSFLDHPRTTDGLNNIYLQTDLGILDILSQTQPAGDFKTINERAVTIPLHGHSCKVISLDDLIKVKENMKRPKDLQAVIELKKVKEQLS